MKTEDLIVQLASTAGPVRPLVRPPVRLARWLGMAIPMAALVIAAIGPRRDLWAVMSQPAFAALVAITLFMAVVAAAASLVLSIPGAERSALQRVVPVMAGATWGVVLVALLLDGGDPIHRVLAWPVHLACVIEIAGIAFVTGWMLLAMLRRAAPLRLGWSAALAALAAVGLGATATQLICPIDDPAHHLVGHLLPAVVFVVIGTIVGRRLIDWLRVSRPQRGR
jgi:hypothetical protein